VLSLYFNWSIRNWRTIVGHLPFANLTCEMALTIALRDRSVVSRSYTPKCSLSARNTLRYPRSRSALAHTSERRDLAADRPDHNSNAERA